MSDLLYMGVILVLLIILIVTEIERRNTEALAHEAINQARDLLIELERIHALNEAMERES